MGTAIESERRIRRTGAVAAVGAVAVALALSSAGCFDPQFPDGKVACQVSADCPPGLACSSGFCFHLEEDGAVVPATGTAGASGHDGGAGFGGATASGGAVGTAGHGGVGGNGGVSGRGGNGGMSGRGGSGAAGPDAGATDGGCAANLCAPGDHRCGPNGLDTCVAVGNCMTWSSDVACMGRKTCQGAAPAAACQCPAPPTGCTGAGKSCVSGALVTCAVDGDGCIYAAASTTCPTSEPCGTAFPNAVCTCPTKPSACTTGQPGTFCDATNKNVVTCAPDANKCLVTTGTIACTSAPCTGTAGSATCGTCPAAPAECTQAGKLCTSAGAQVETCGLDTSGCMANLGASGCPSPQVCGGALPNAGCACPAAPPVCMNQAGTVCSAAGSTTVVTCGMVNGCLTTTASKICPSPETCTGSLPSAGCGCPTVAACQSGVPGSYCDTNSGNLVTCTEDGNGCFAASNGPCQTGLICSGSFPNGKCVCPGVPNCPATGKSCSGTTLVTCTQDSQSCLHEADTNCAATGLVCSMAGGVAGCNCPAPTMGCGSGASKSCTGDLTLLTCTNNSQGCTQGQTTTCQTGQYCWSTMLACLPPTAVGFPTDLGTVSNKTGGVLVGESVAITATSIVRSLGLIAGAAGGSLVSIGLYSDVGGAPSQLVASAQNKAVLAGRNEYAASPVSGGSLQIAAGTYWIMAVYDVTTPIEAAMTGGTTVTRQSFNTGWGSPLPGTLSGTTPQTGAATNYYVLITQ